MVAPGNELEVLRKTGLNVLTTRTSSLNPHDLSVAIHWGMVMAVYPFWTAVSSQTGQLLKLQGFASASQVQRRIRELYGERQTVSRATQRILRTYFDWGALQETGKKGVHSAGKMITVKDTLLAVWLVEASLHGRIQGSTRLNEMFDNPALFPILIKPIPAESLVNLSPRLELVPSRFK
jgi:hypothetical protein